MSRRPPSDPPDDEARPGGSARDDDAWARVHDHFDEALALEPEPRRRFLDALEASEPALALEVRSLLEAHEASEGFLSEPPAMPARRALEPGDRLGVYRVIAEIGAGGMGVVYLASREDRDFANQVAIKVLDPAMQSEGVLRRFRAERQILGRLDHRNIVRLLDGGTAPDGSPYLVMEHVAGRPLLEYCDHRRLGITARIQLFLEVCEAVQFAHQRLVVHRDLKSDNVLVTDDGSVRLLDFGIAKLIAPDDQSPAVTLTAPMQRMLTPDYASPEQVRGEPAAVSSDVYSLGVLLYELLAGERPLRFRTRTPEEVLRVVTQVEPEPPSRAVTRALGEQAAGQRGLTTARLRRQLAGDLDYVVLRALEKDPARRYGSVEQLAADLRRHLGGFAVLARGRSTTYRLSRYLRRHRLAVFATSAIVVALVAGLAGTAWQARVAGRERDKAKQRFDDVRALAHDVVFDLHDAIATLPGSTRVRELLVSRALRYLDRLSRESAGDHALQHELGVAYSKIGDVQGRPMFSNLGQPTAALTSYRKSLELLRGVAAAWPDSVGVARDLVVTMQRLADLENAMGHPREALALTLQTRQRAREEFARHPRESLLGWDVSLTFDRAFDLRLAAGDTLGALAEGRAGSAMVESLAVAGPADAYRRAMLIRLLKFGMVFAAMGRGDSAAAGYERAEKVAREAVAAAPENLDALRDLSIAYGLHGMLLAGTGQTDSALAVYGRGMRISETLAARDPADALPQSDVADGHYEIGSILMKGRRYEPAERRYEEAFGRYARLLSADSGNAEAREKMAQSARAAGEACEAVAGRAPAAERARWRARALEWYGRSLAIYRRLEAARALTGTDVRAPGEVAERIAKLRAAP